MLPMLKAWMGEIARILSPPVPSENTDDWGLRTEALKVLMRMVENFPKLVAAEFSGELKIFCHSCCQLSI
jgi:hypothetical protein